MTKQQQTSTVTGTGVAATAVTALALLLLSACGTESGSGSGVDDARSVSGTDDTSLTETLRNAKGINGVKGTVWDIDSVTVDGKKTTPVDGARMRVDPDGTFRSSPDCNLRTAGEVTVKGDTLDVGDDQGMSTLKLCPDEERPFADAFDKVFSGKLTARTETVPGRSDPKTDAKDPKTDAKDPKTDAKDPKDPKTDAQDAATDTKRVTLTAPGGDTIVLTRQTPQPLTGTVWTVDEVVDSVIEHGDTEGSLPAGTEGKASLTLRKGADGAGGTVEGSDGCNTFRGPVKISEATNKITFGPLRTTRKACPKPEMALQERFEKVLKGEIEYELSHNRLKLLAGNGLGVAAGPAA
ncbi:META domain-containing protein [Streptomyces corynorhini]|uniref:META domain-containing protein n=1 Tax=Streptomyces corynorhini TaxID=2282652 RepID=A0A370B5F5_9ACTN|nr:META domain-containing protein [Streptomyces corynorhini]RDG34615.1 META domain-containing protein [Streptomyces corynorhini]